MNTNSHVLPETDRDPSYSTKHALQLALVAAREALHNLRSTIPDNKLQTVYREMDDGYFSTDILAPDYRSKEVWESIDRVWRSPGFDELSDYLWENGSFKKNLSPRSDRKSWARFAWSDLIHAALLRTLWLSATERLVDDGSVEPWWVNQSELKESLSEILADEDARANGNVRVRAACLFRAVELPNADKVPLSDTVNLMPCSLRDLLVFFTRFSSVFSWSEIFHSGAAVVEVLKFALLEIKRTIPITANADPKVQKLMSVERILDSFKIAAMDATGSDMPVAESRCIIENILGNPSATINRADHLRSFPPYRFDANSLAKLKADFNSVIVAAQTNQDFADALFFFGRSATAPLSRDVLLEAAVGLDRLLAVGSESRYRVSLHGSVLMSDDTEGVDGAFKRLGAIYNKRSGFAHGSTSDDEELAESARTYLARILMTILRLAQSGEINLDDGIRDQVESYVRHRAARRV